MARKMLFIPPVLLVVGLLVWAYFNTPAASETRANTSMEVYIEKTKVVPLRQSCSWDSDGDGYASCTIATGAEVIQLQCSAGFLGTLPVIGSKSCKEQLNQVIKLPT